MKRAKHEKAASAIFWLSSRAFFGVVGPHPPSTSSGQAKPLRGRASKTILREAAGSMVHGPSEAMARMDFKTAAGHAEKRRAWGGRAAQHARIVL